MCASEERGDFHQYVYQNVCNRLFYISTDLKLLKKNLIIHLLVSRIKIDLFAYVCSEINQLLCSEINQLV